MKPELQKIFTKLSEEKLQKVDLSAAKARALVKEFNKAEQGMKAKKKVLDSLLQEFKKLETLKTKAEKEYKESLDFQNIYLEGKDTYDIVFDDLEKQAKDLGIDVGNVPIIDVLNNSFDAAADAYRPLHETQVLIGRILDKM